MDSTPSETISNFKVVPLSESLYLKPLRVEFTLNEHKKYWDFLKVHDSVSILIYNVSRKVVVLVKQFRPSMYVGRMPNIDVGTTIDTTKYPLTLGYSLELCAGIVDKNKPSVEIAREEVLEECGYDVPTSSIQHLFSFRGVGVTGHLQELYYVEVTDDQKVSEGGGLVEEGECIQVIELTVPQLKDYIEKKDILSPAGFMAAVQWFLHNIVSKET